MKGLSTSANYRRIKRRLKAGISLQDAMADKKNRAGNTSQFAKLTPSQAIEIYMACFYRKKTQQKIAKEYGIHQSTVSDIWRHKRWGWLTSVVRFDLEKAQ